MIYYGVFIADDPTANGDDRGEDEARLHLLVEAKSFAEAEKSFVAKLRQLWDTCAIEPRFTQLHPVEVAEMQLAPREPACLYLSLGPVQSVLGEPGVTRYAPQVGADRALPLFLDRLHDVPPVKWVPIEPGR